MVECLETHLRRTVRMKVLVTVATSYSALQVYVPLWLVDKGPSHDRVRGFVPVTWLSPTLTPLYSQDSCKREQSEDHQ